MASKPLLIRHSPLKCLDPWILARSFKHQHKYYSELAGRLHTDKFTFSKNGRTLMTLWPRQAR